MCMKKQGKALSVAMLLMVTTLAFVFALVGCNAQTKTSDTSSDANGAAQTETKSSEDDLSGVNVRVASLKGPTSIGIVDLMSEAKSGNLEATYDFTIAGTADEVLPSIISGDTDIALVPANAASILYNKTEGKVSVIDINTLGVLYVVTADSSITSVEDLAGHTVYLTGKGTTPEYVTNYLLDAAGISDQVSLEFKTEATELAALLEADPMAIAILPEPYATSTIAKNASLTRAVSLTDTWDELQGADGSALVTGVTVVRNDFMADHPSVVAEFVAAHTASVEAVNADPSAAATLVVEAGIVANEKVAAVAIPYCNLVCVTGDEMQSMLSGYLSALFEQDPSSVGGKLPNDDFYALM